jgi:hypothetical protein
MSNNTTWNKDQVLTSLSHYKDRLTTDMKFREAFAVGMCIQIIKEEGYYMSEPQSAIEALWDALWPGPGHNPYPLNKDKGEDDAEV